MPTQSRLDRTIEVAQEAFSQMTTLAGWLRHRARTPISVSATEGGTLTTFEVRTWAYSEWLVLDENRSIIDSGRFPFHGDDEFDDLEEAQSFARDVINKFDGAYDEVISE